MATTQLTKNWTITANYRITFVSLNDCMSDWLYQNKVAMVAAGWSVIFTCNGTTGPTGSGDTTDRWTSKAACTTRATVDAAAQSYAVLQNADGVQVLLDYQGASDDICRLSCSYGGLFTLAGTSTNRPTATDELIFSAANTIINATASADRVISIGCTNESWWIALFRAGSFINHIGLEKIDSACPSAVFAKPYVGFRFTSNTRQYGPATGTATGIPPNVAVGSAGCFGPVARVFTAGANRNNRLGGGGINVNGVVANQVNPQSNDNGGVMNTDQPALQNLAAMPLLPIYWTGEQGANLDGLIGSPIDFWQPFSTNSTTKPATGDMFGALEYSDSAGAAARSNWLVAFGPGIVRPWKNAAASLVTS